MLSLPHIPDNIPSTYLVICLAQVSNAARVALKAELERLAKLADGDDGSHPCIIHPVERKLNDGEEEVEAIDRVENIHALARTARLRNWTRFAVFDNRSLRQLEDTTVFGEPESLSIVLVGVASSPKRGLVDDKQGNCIIAVRKDASDAIPILVHNKDFNLEALSPDFNDLDVFNLGHILYSPLDPPFTSEIEKASESNRRNQYINTALEKYQLPNELKNMIFEHINTGIPLDQLTAAPAQLDMTGNILHIHVLSKLSEVESQEMTTIIDAQIQKHYPEATCVLHGWIGVEPGNRRQLWQLWQRLVDNNEEPAMYLSMFFVQPDLWKHDHLIGVLNYNYPRAVPISKVDIKDVAGFWQAMKKPPLEVSKDEFDRNGWMLEENPNRELLLNPEAPFHRVWPAWKPETGSDSSPPVAVFFLTSSLPAEDEERIKETLFALDEVHDEYLIEEEYEKEFTFIPWDHQEDATIDDVWRIFLQCYSFQGYREGSSFIFCIDSESARDGNVLLVDADYEYNSDFTKHKFRGMQYGRIEFAVVYGIWTNLSIGNLSFEDYIPEGEGHYYALPGYEPMQHDTPPLDETGADGS